jgi:general stress protein 26
MTNESGFSLAAFVGFGREIGLAVVATTSLDGKPEAALVGIAVSDLGELIFDTHADARKVGNLRHHHRVAAVISSGDVSVQIEGRAGLVDGEDRRTYEQMYAAQFPRSRVADPSFAVVVITPEWVRRYDASVDPALTTLGDWLPTV